MSLRIVGRGHRSYQETATGNAKGPGFDLATPSLNHRTPGEHPRSSAFIEAYSPGGSRLLFASVFAFFGPSRLS